VWTRGGGTLKIVGYLSTFLMDKKKPSSRFFGIVQDDRDGSRPTCNTFPVVSATDIPFKNILTWGSVLLARASPIPFFFDDDPHSIYS